MRFLLSFLVAVSVYAQASMTSTSLTYAVSPSDLTVVVASATGITAPGAQGQGRIYIYVDKELMAVDAVSGTALRVQRGINGTVATAHNAAATVYAGPANQYAASIVTGACTASDWPVTPRITPSAGVTQTCTGGVWSDTTGGGGGGTGDAIETATLATLPATCAVGDVRWVTDATPAGIYQCYATDNWARQTTAVHPDGTLTEDTSAGVTRHRVTPNVFPQLAGTNAFTGSNTFAASTAFTGRTGAADPGTCSAGEEFYNTTSNTKKICTAANTWTSLGGGGQTLASKSLFAPFGFPGDSVVDSGTFTALTVYYWQFDNPYGSLPITHISRTGYTGQASRVFVMGIYDGNCNLLAQTDGATAFPTSGTYTSVALSSTATLTTPKGYLAFATDATTGTVATFTGSEFRSIVGSLPDAAEYAFTGSNAATQPGGTNTTITLPASCGTKTVLTGNKRSPIVSVMWRN